MEISDCLPSLFVMLIRTQILKSHTRPPSRSCERSEWEVEPGTAKIRRQPLKCG